MKNGLQLGIGLILTGSTMIYTGIRRQIIQKKKIEKEETNDKFQIILIELFKEKETPYEEMEYKKGVQLLMGSPLDKEIIRGRRDFVARHYQYYINAVTK